MISIESMNDDGPKLDINDLLSKGWVYRDLPRMPKPYYDYVLASMGKEGEDFHMLTKARYDYEDKKSDYRGQLVISPKGRENMVEYQKNNPIPEL